MKRYNPKDIEPKWQKIWDETNVYTTNLKSQKPKYVGMSMFNYPSGAGIHIGHAMNYTISDVKARFKRQQGYESYHPVGWDSFGLPAENYAIKAGVSPQESMASIIPGYHTQYKAMGWSNDWEKEIATHTPEYYKWTQWIFSEMYRNNLAYQDARMQWWCEKCQTVLANEQVIDGKCWRHDGADDPIVEKKEVKQWFFKITDYADELLEAIDSLDWSESVKLAQKNWIGKSMGAEINFSIDGSDDLVTVFTTRADTLFGATFLVLAPEHDLVAKITSEAQQNTVVDYVKTAAKKTEVERQAAKEKTGVFTGAYAINPVNNKKVPIWIADYVLAGYGTGAVMAVPAHDERDNEFAKKYNLPIVEVVEPETGTPQKNPEFRQSIVAIVHDSETQKYLSINWGEQGGNLFVGGGRDANEDGITCAQREVAEETGFTNLEFKGQTSKIHHNYFAHSKGVARRIEAHGLLFELKDKTRQDTQLEDDEKNQFTVEWLTAQEVEARITDELHMACYDLLVKGNCFSGEGIMTNSGAYNGMSSAEAREKIVADLSAIELSPVFQNADDVIDAVKKDQPFVEREAITAIIKHWKEDKYLGLKWKTADWDTFVTGGVDEGQTPEEAAIREIQEETGYQNLKLVKNLGRNHAKFYHIPKKENRFAHFTCLYFELEDGEKVEVDAEEQEIHSAVWLTPAQLEAFRLPASHRFAWNKLLGKESQAYVAREVTNYKMRDWSVSRQRYWGAPIPVVSCRACGTVLLPDSQLPVVLPELTDFKPSGDGRSALARADDWLKTTCPECGGEAERETDTLDTYICSSWYMYRYMDPHNQDQIFDSELVKKWEPIDFYNGADHATAHLLYARFIARFFTKLGLVNNPEPFKQFLFNGKVTASDGTMFSKSKGNGVDPLEIIAQGYGADALRLYLMFAAPLEVWAKWDSQGVPGAFRFLTRLWNLVQEYLEAPEQEAGAEDQKKLLAATHKMIKKATHDIEENRYNTAIAATMAGLNDFYLLKKTSLGKNESWQNALESIVAVVAPFAPHITDELWNQLGHSSSVHVDSWPAWDEKYLETDTVKIVVQINGKVRVTVDAPSEADEEVVLKLVRGSEKITTQLAGKEVKKTIYIPGKLVNFVV